MVFVAPVNKMMELESSLMAVIQDMIAPVMTPGSIMTAVILKNVRSGDAPRLIEASSMLGLS